MSFLDLFSKKQKMFLDGSIIIEYQIKNKPPNFRMKDPPNKIGMENTCGNCKFIENFTTAQPDCKKYGVRYQGIGCLDKTVCDDHKNILFDFT